MTTLAPEARTPPQKEVGYRLVKPGWTAEAKAPGWPP